MYWGDYLYVKDVEDHKMTNIVELDQNFNDKIRTISSIDHHNLLIHFTSDHVSLFRGFSALIHYLPHNANCADFLDETELNMTQAIDCNWIITTPSTTGTITIKFQELEVSI